jgi:GntR family transcriptional regulator/MocR family aminotransferase
MHLAAILSAIVLERAGPAPLFRQLYQGVRDAILSGAIAPGTQLPPTRALCALLGISRQTVLAAYEQLTAEGYLCGAVGRGTFVSASLPARRAAPARAPQLRPQSGRGKLFAQAMGAVRHHTGPVRAFRTSMPALDLFPFDAWSRLEARCWRRPDHQFGYGDPAGYLPLREHLCDYLGASRGVICTPDQVIITSGSQQALYLLAVTLLDPGDEVWTESPGYQGAVAPLEAAGARVRTLPVTPDGMDVAHGAARYPQARLVFATPSHQLPTGVTMSLRRRLELLEWARRARAWIVEDDYDSEYRYTGPPLASLQSLDRAGTVVYVGTLSKVLFPALRLGYLVAPPGLAGPLARAKAVIDRTCPIVPQMTLARFIAEGHFGRHIRRTREAYGERRAALLDGLARHLPDQLTCGPADAGLDVCAWLRRPLDEPAAVQACLDAGIELRGVGYYRNPAATRACAVPPGLVLGFAAVAPAPIDSALRTLARVLRAMPAPG